MSYRVEPLEPDKHREQLLELWATSMVEDRIADCAPERYKWLYEGNPTGPTHTFVGMHVESDSVMGCASIVARRIAMGGRIASGGMLCDFAIDKKHRTAGPAIAIQRRIGKESVGVGAEFLFGYPNEAAKPIFKRLRWIFVGEAGAYVKPLRSEYKVRERISNPILAKLGGIVVDTALRASQARHFLRQPRLFRTDITRRADARFDDLWQRTRPRFITGEKDAAYLNWRYAEFPTADNKFFLLLSKGQLLGFVAYTVEDGVALVADMHCDLERDLDLLLFAYAERMRREKHQSIYIGYAGNDFMGNTLKAHHFFKRPHERTLLAYVDKSAPDELRERVSDIQNWHLFDGELDI
jgi:hypothetical protein